MSPEDWDRLQAGLDNIHPNRKKISATEIAIHQEEYSVAYKMHARYFAKMTPDLADTSKASAITVDELLRIHAIATVPAPINIPLEFS
jgi:hypothetical protein